MSTSNKPTESFVDRVENFFGLKKQPTESTSSHERLHDNVHASADADAAHRAAMVSDKIPTPVPTQILDQVKHQHGKVPLAGGHHVDINKVEAEHQPQGLGHVMKEPNMLDKMGAAFRNVTSSQSSSSSSTMTTSTIPAKDNIPHSSLPNDTLKEIQSAKGSVPHAHHVDINKVEQQHQPAGLGHVQKEPNMMEKMGTALKNMTGSMPSATSTSTSTSIHTRDNIPHSALSNNTLTDIQKAKGSVPHAHHVDINKVEAQHQPQGLGHVQETCTMDKMKQTLHNMAEKITPDTSSSESSSKTGNYAKVTLTSPHSHSSLPDYVLQDIPKAHVPAATGHHVDVNRIEAEHNRRLSLGRVVGDVSTLDQRAAQHQPIMTERQPSLVDKVQDVATRVSDKLMGTSAPVQQHDNIPQSALGPAVMKDIRQQHGQVPNAHHVPVIEHPSVPLGHVVDTSTKRD